MDQCCSMGGTISTRLVGCGVWGVGCGVLKIKGTVAGHFGSWGLEQNQHRHRLQDSPVPENCTSDVGGWSDEGFIIRVMGGLTRGFVFRVVCGLMEPVCCSMVKLPWTEEPDVQFGQLVW